MADKRERLDVIHDILNCILKYNNSVGPTRLIQTSNLSPAMFKEYTEELLNSGLISKNVQKNKKIFSVTDKGFKFIQEYKFFKNFVTELGL